MKITPKKPVTDDVLVEQMMFLVKPRARKLYAEFMALLEKHAHESYGGDFTKAVATWLKTPALIGQPGLCKMKMLMAMNTMVTSGLDEFINSDRAQMMGDWGAGPVQSQWVLDQIKPQKP